MLDGDATGLQTALIDRLRRITETPAPTSGEAARAALVASFWRSAGTDPEIDEVGNVVVEVSGGRGPRVLIAAHLDTVFGADVDVTVRDHGDRLYAPGIGDNSASLAVLSVFLDRLSEQEEESRPRLTLAATVGEEGVGDLRGARHLMERRGQQHEMFIALDGRLDTVVVGAVGSKRFEFRFRAKGGHSWGDYPSPSAVHAAGEAIHALLRIKLPRTPRTSLNVGQVWGGTGINAIAEEAGFNLDLRSVDRDALESLTVAATQAVRRVARTQASELNVQQVGDRPVARVDNDALVAAARRALAAVGIEVRELLSSTDANAALAAGIPAIAFGVTRGGDAHRATEWVETDSLSLGYAAFVALLAALVDP